MRVTLPCAVVPGCISFPPHVQRSACLCLSLVTRVRLRPRCVCFAQLPNGFYGTSMTLSHAMDPTMDVILAYEQVGPQHPQPWTEHPHTSPQQTRVHPPQRQPGSQEDAGPR